MTDDLQVACIGLGKMGTGIAENVLRAGFATVVWNRSAEKAEPLVAAGARLADSPRQATKGADVVVSCLFDDASVLAATLGPEGILAGLAAGAVHAGATTVSPALTRRLATEHADQGRGYLAAHVLGRPEAVRDGELLVLAGGPPEARAKAGPVLDAISRAVVDIGPDAAQASHAKLAANCGIVVALELMGEIYAWAGHAGLDRAVAESLLDGLLAGPALPAYNHRVAARSFAPGGFALQGGLKDVDLMLGAAAEVGVDLPAARVVRDRLRAAVDRGMGDLDWSAVTELADPGAGVRAPEPQPRP